MFVRFGMKKTLVVCATAAIHTRAEKLWATILPCKVVRRKHSRIDFTGPIALGIHLRLRHLKGQSSAPDPSVCTVQCTSMVSFLRVAMRATSSHTRTTSRCDTQGSPLTLTITSLRRMPDACATSPFFTRRTLTPFCAFASVIPACADGENLHKISAGFSRFVLHSRPIGTARHSGHTIFVQRVRVMQRV